MNFQISTSCLLIGLLFISCVYSSVIQVNKEKENIENALESFKKTSNIYKAKQFKGETLAFLTPWNKQGFERALKFSNKLNYISPVWFEIKEVDYKPQLVGDHNIDRDFLNKIKELNKDNTTNIKILPRIYIQDEQILVAFTDMWNRQKVIDEILKHVDLFDGFVFDSVYLSYFQASRQYDQIAFVRELSTALRQKHNKLLFASIQGKQDRFKWKPSHMIVLLDLIDKLLVSTYDYHKIIDSYYPINPINWVQENIDFFEQKNREKVLIGMPFYGFKISNKVDYLMGEEMKKLIDEDDIDSVEWADVISECVFSSSAIKTIKYYYPCLKFIEQRLKLYEKEKLGGVYIWELGQGQDFLLEPF